jgi:exopolysaccharide production protein ExoZ
MSKNTSWNVGIQILRGLAAALVVFHHSLEESLAISAKIAPEWVIRLGACGVDIFFVISGFIIYSVTYGRDPRNPEKAPWFLLKRVIRIYPLYWICLLATIALWSSGHFYRGLHIDGSTLVSSVFLLPNNKMIVGVAWTLVYEMYFYCLFSIMLYLRNARTSVLGVTTFICAGMLISNLLPEGVPKHFLANPIALEFCFGVILSYFIHSKALDQVWLRYLWLPGLIFMAAGAAFAENEGQTSGIVSNIRYFAWGLPALLMVVSFIQIRFGRSLLTRILMPIGDASYAIYLTHPTMMIIFAFLIRFHLAKPIAYPIIYPLFFTLISIVLGLLTHYFLERPILSCLRSCLLSKHSEGSGFVGQGVVGADRQGKSELVLGAEKPL